MATLIPAINTCLSRMTAGERRFGQRLEQLLEEDYLCWYDVPVGPKALHPDFVVLHPRRGILILEVKDWKLETIKQMDKTTASILTPEGLKRVANPLEQARQYCHAVVKCLERDSQLVYPRNHSFKGRLLMPFGHGVILTNITRQQFEQTDLGEVIPSNRVICKDEMTESVDAEVFQSRLWNMFAVQFQRALSLPQIDRVRWHLFPEVRIVQGSLFDAEVFDTETDPGVVEWLPDLIKVMDLQQEQLARSLGEGHRVIHGVAGAGKTLILVYRCLYLAKVMSRPILVLCYNRPLAARLNHLVCEKGIADKVQVYNFHRWCRQQLLAYNESLPLDGPQFSEQLVQRLIAAVDAGRIPAGQYGAVMLDEGHDFQPEWLKLAAQMVDPSTNALLVLYDDAQSIYTRSRSKFSFASVGIQARGRTTILKLNYRNTEEVIKVASAFARELLTEAEAEEDGIPLLAPTSAGRKGAAPLLLELPGLSAEIHYIAERLQTLHDKGRPWNQMAVVYRSNFMGDKIRKTLAENAIPCEILADQKANAAQTTNSVKLVTMHSSKGLEFPVVFVAGLGYLPSPKQEEKEEARLLYVAMTRAIDELILTGHKNSGFMGRMRAVMVTAGH